MFPERLLARLRPGARIPTTGLHGAARAWLLAQLAAASGRKVACITADDDAAEALATDLALFFGGQRLRREIGRAHV